MRIKIIFMSALITLGCLFNAVHADPNFFNIGGYYVCQTEFRLVSGEPNVPEPHYHAANFSFVTPTYQAILDSSNNITGAQMLDPNAPVFFTIPADVASVPAMYTPAFFDPNPTFEGYGLATNVVFSPLPVGGGSMNPPSGPGGGNPGSGFINSNNFINVTDSANFSESINIRDVNTQSTPQLQNAYTQSSQFVNNNNLFEGSFTRTYRKIDIASLNGFDALSNCCGIGDPLSQWDYSGPEYDCSANGTCNYDFTNTSQQQINEAKQQAIAELEEVQNENRDFIAGIDRDIEYWQGRNEYYKTREGIFDANLTAHEEDEGFWEKWDELYQADDRERYLTIQISVAQGMQEYTQTKINELNAEKNKALARHADQEEQLMLEIVRTDPVLVEIWTNRNNQLAIDAAREVHVQNLQNNQQITAHEQALADKDAEIATAIENNDWDLVDTLQTERDKIAQSLNDVVEFGQKIVFNNGKQLHLVYSDNAGSGFGYSNFNEMLADLQSQGIDFRDLSDEEKAQVRAAADSGARIAQGSLLHQDPILNIFDNPGSIEAWGSFYYDYYIQNAIDLHEDPALFFTRSWAYYKGVGHAVKDGVVDLAILVYYLGHLQLEVYQSAFNYVADTDIRIVDDTVTSALGTAYASIDEVSFDAYSEFVYVNSQALFKALGRQFEMAAGSGEAGIEKGIQATGYVFTTILGGEEIAFRAVAAGVKGFKVIKLGKVIGKGKDGLTIARGTGVVSDFTPGQIADLQNAFEQGHALDGSFTLDQLIAAEKQGLIPGVAGVGGVNPPLPAGEGVPVLAGVLIDGADESASSGVRAVGAGDGIGIGGGDNRPVAGGFSDRSPGSSGESFNPIDSGARQASPADAPYNPIDLADDAVEGPARGWNDDFDGFEIQLSEQDLIPPVDADFGMNVLKNRDGKNVIAPVGTVTLPDGTKAVLGQKTYIHQGSTSAAYHAYDEAGNVIMRNGKPVVVKLTKNPDPDAPNLDLHGYELLSNAGLDPSKVHIPEWHSTSPLPYDTKLGDYNGGIVSVIDEAPADFSRQGRSHFTPEELTAYEVGVRELESKGIIIFDNKADNFYFIRGADGKLVLGLPDNGSALQIIDPLTGAPDPKTAREIRELMDSGNYAEIPQATYDSWTQAYNNHPRFKGKGLSEQAIHNKVMRDWRHNQLAQYDDVIDWQGTGFTSLEDFPFVPSYLGRPDGRFPGVQTLADGDVSKMTDSQLYSAMKGSGWTDAEIEEFIDLPDYVQQAILNNPNPTAADIIGARRAFLADLSPQEFNQWAKDRGIPDNEVDWMDEINPQARDGAVRSYEYGEQQARDLADLDNQADYDPIESDGMTDENFKQYLRDQGYSEAEIDDYMNQPNEPLLADDLSESGIIRENMREQGLSESEIDEIMNQPNEPILLSEESAGVSNDLPSQNESLNKLNDAVIDMDSSQMDVPPLLEGDGLASRYPIKQQKAVNPGEALLALMQQRY